MRRKRFSPPWLILPISMLGVAVSSAAAEPDAVHNALGRIQPGQWSLRELDGSATVKSVCVADPAALIQLRHPNTNCSRFVIESLPDTVTVHYTCPRAGYGRTTIKVETGGLIRIDSQGIANNAPFSTALEGRRIGACGGSAGPNRAGK